MERLRTVIYGLAIVFVFSGAVFGDHDTNGDASPSRYFAERFRLDTNLFDLMYTSALFTPTVDGSAYTAEIQVISQLPTDLAGGVNLPLADNDFRFVKLAGSAEVSIYGNSFTGFYVGSNGYITFTQGDQDASETLAEHFNTLRVSGLFRDLSPNVGGQVSYKQLADRVAVTWRNVPEFGTNNSNTFQIILYYDGRIQISWENIDAEHGVVGLSDGRGKTADFRETDFSELLPPPSSGLNDPAERFRLNTDPFDLMYTSVLFTPTPDGLAYTATLQPISQLPTDSAGGINLALADDDFRFVKLAGSTEVSIYGISFASFYVGSNGYVTFTSGDQDASETLAEHFDTLRVSGLFRDLSPNAGGQVSYKQLADRVAVTWRNVPEHGTNNSNTFQIILYYDGRIQISWENIDAEHGVVGLSDGRGKSADLRETDFSELPPPPPPPPPSELNDPVEQFTGGDDAFDLENTSVTFTPTDTDAFYTASAEVAAKLPTDPSGGTNLTLGDDAFVFVKLANSKTVSIYRNDFSSFYVGSNGYITFTEGDQDYSESLEDHFDTLRVSLLFGDLNPSGGGQVSWKQLNDRVAVTWLNVPVYGGNGSNTFQAELFFDGTIRLTWLTIASTTGIVGLSDGAGVPPDFKETNFSELAGGTPPPPPPVTDYLTEEFTGGSDPFDLEYKSVTFTPNADGTSYTGSLQSISQLPTNPSGGTNLGLSDDNWVRVVLSNQARIKIFDQSYSTFYVGSNGYITFTEGDQDYSQTLAEHFDTLRISGLYCDLTVAAAGSVTGKQMSNRVAITWQGVSEFNNNARNTFQIEMYYDGRIRISWLDIGSRANIVGLSNGQGLPSDFEEMDFSVQYAP